MSFLDSVKSVITDSIVEKIADTIGVETDTAKSAMGLFLPSIIAGVINKGSNAKDAGSFVNLFQAGKFGDINTGDILSLLGNQKETNGSLEKGRELLGTLFGNNQSNVIDLLTNKISMGRSESSGLLSFLAPVVMNKLAGLATDRNYDANGLSSFLVEQKPEIQSLVPEIFSMLSDSDETQEISIDSTIISSDQDTTSSGRNGFLKWFIPLFLGAILIWVLAKNGCTPSGNGDQGTDDTEHVEQNEDDRTKETINENSNPRTNRKQINLSDVDLSAIDFNDKNDIMGGNGTVLVPFGSYKVDESGNVIGPGNVILIEVGKMPESFKEKLNLIMSEN